MRQRIPVFLREFFSSLRDFDWSELRHVSTCGYWPFAVHVVICAGSVVLVLLVASVLLVPTLNASWQATQGLSSVLADEHSELTARLDSVMARNLGIASQRARHAYLHQRLLPAEPMPVVLDRLREVAAAHGATVSTLRPQNTGQHASRQAFEIDFRFQADKQQLTALLSDIGTLPLALAIHQVDWQVASSHVRLQLFLLVATSRRTGVDVFAVDARHHPDRPADDDADWQRVAFIQRGNRYLEVQRDSRGETRRRVGERVEVGQ